MSTKLPLEIRRNYSIKDVGHAWTLKCIVCDQAWQLNKPEKGKSVHGGNILHLLDHAASHPLPTEEEVVEAPTSIVEPLAEPVVELVAPVAPISKVVLHQANAVPTARNPHAYRVVLTGLVTTVSHFRETNYDHYRQVEKVANGYSVIIFASNPKHASLVGTRLINQFMESQKGVM